MHAVIDDTLNDQHVAMSPEEARYVRGALMSAIEVMRATAVIRGTGEGAFLLNAQAATLAELLAAHDEAHGLGGH